MDRLIVSEKLNVNRSITKAYETEFAVERNIVKNVNLNYDTEISYVNGHEIKSLYMRNGVTGKIIEVAAYYTKNHFPLGEKAVTLKLNDGTELYIPVDYVGSEFDTGIRYNDGSNIYQVSSQIVFDILIYKLNAYNMLIPTKDITYLYKTFTYLFGKNKVKLYNDAVKLKCPSAAVGVTKLLFLGPNWDIFNKNGLTINSYDSGNPVYTFGNTKDDSIIDRAVLIKLYPGQEIFIRLNMQDESLDNYIVLGNTVENEFKENGEFKNLKNTDAYCIYVEEIDRPKRISIFEDTYFKPEEYIRFHEYISGIHDYKYNYFDMQDIKYV